MFSRAYTHACKFRILEGDRKRLFEVSVGLRGILSKTLRSKPKENRAKMFIFNI